MYRSLNFVLVAFAAFVLSSTPLHAGFVNGSFEAPSIATWAVAGPGGQATPSFDGELPTDGVKMALIETEPGLSVAILDLISGGALGVGPGYLASAFPSATEGALLYQTVTLFPGESAISFDWNFLTNEFTPDASFNDFAIAHLFSGGSLVDSAMVDTFGTFSGSGSLFTSHTGWSTTTFTGLAPGGYSLLFGVFDYGDTGVSSALLVDNVRTIPEPSAVLLSGLAVGLVSSRRRRI